LSMTSNMAANLRGGLDVVNRYGGPLQ